MLIYLDSHLVKLIIKIVTVCCVTIKYLESKMRTIYEGITRGSLLSPILCTIYITKTDQFIVEILLFIYNKKKKDKFLNSEYIRLKTFSMIKKKCPINCLELEKSFFRLKYKKFLTDGTLFEKILNRSFNKMYYLRYSNFLLVGFLGSKSQLNKIYTSILKFMYAKFKLKCNEYKILLDSSRKQFKYLGIILR